MLTLYGYEIPSAVYLPTAVFTYTKRRQTVQQQFLSRIRSFSNEADLAVEARDPVRWSIAASSYVDAVVKLLTARYFWAYEDGTEDDFGSVLASLEEVEAQFMRLASPEVFQQALRRKFSSLTTKSSFPSQPQHSLPPGQHSPSQKSPIPSSADAHSCSMPSQPVAMETEAMFTPSTAELPRKRRKRRCRRHHQRRKQSSAASNVPSDLKSLPVSESNVSPPTRPRKASRPWILVSFRFRGGGTMRKPENSNWSGKEGIVHVCLDMDEERPKARVRRQGRMKTYPHEEKDEG